MSDAAGLYERDYYAWALDQAEKLRGWPEHLRPNGIDAEAVAEELEGLARSEARRFESLFTQLFAHLLKVEWHPAQESRAHWAGEIRLFRRDLLRHGDKTSRFSEPTLWAQRETIAAEAWGGAIEAVVARLDLEDRGRAAIMLRTGTDPARPHFDLDSEALHPEWLPPYRGPEPTTPAPRRRSKRS